MPSPPRPRALRTDREPAPNNLDPARPPEFSWRAAAETRGAGQSACRIVVGRERERVAAGEGDVWDSGRVETTDATNVAYDGPPLAPDETYFWSVRLWDEDGTSSAWADPATFTTALRPRDWRGEWVGYQPVPGDTNGWRGDWRPADWDGEEWVGVDLGAEQRVAAVTLHPASPKTVVRTPDGAALAEGWDGDPMTGFGFPGAYRIEVADAPSFADPVVVARNGDAAEDGAARKSAPETHAGLAATGRYVRVVATDLHALGPETAGDSRTSVRHDRWRCFALAALGVAGADGRDAAAGAPVSASSSVESATWGREHLVNGETASSLAASSPLLRTTFDAEGEVDAARLHVAAVGYGETYVNGERVGESRLDPAWTNYEERVLYSSYDVGDMLREGENALGLWLGRGWFAKSGAYWRADGSPRARATLTVRFADGTTRTVSTGESWRAAPSPVVENDIYDGERYDARREREGWAAPGFDDSDWDSVHAVDPPGGELRPQRVQSMGVVETFEPEEIRTRPDGALLDFGQNLTGWLALDVDAEAGAEVTLEHAEALTESGDLSTVDLRSADATDTYVSDGTPGRYEPRFTYHGFRYAHVRAPDGAVDFEDVTAKVVHTAMDRRGAFACSNDDLNRVQHNAVWGLRGNTHSVPEDCPQRDERFGWTGDAQISTRSLLFNFDAGRFDRKWARDHDDAASSMGYVPEVVPSKPPAVSDPTWSVTRVMVPWHLYRHEGDEAILRAQYEGMRAYLDYWQSVTEDGVLPAEYGKFGDWLAFENTDEADDRRGLPLALFNTAFHYQATDTFARIAAVLGNRVDAAAYRERAERVKEAFNERFYRGDGTYGPGTQSALAVPLFVGLVPDAETERVVAELVAKVNADGRKLKTGFLGTRPLLHTLAAHGRADLAYEIVSQPERPGWVYMARQGATTVWERWDSDSSVGSGMNSLNHSPFTHVSEFFYEVLAGIRVGGEPLTDRVTVAPALVDDLDWVEANVETPNGDLRVEWERTADGYELRVDVPWNTDATVVLPDAADAPVTEGDAALASGDSSAAVEAVEAAGADLRVAVGAGTYTFRVS